jgi:hypothetical protein
MPMQEVKGATIFLGVAEQPRPASSWERTSATTSSMPRMHSETPAGDDGMGEALVMKCPIPEGAATQEALVVRGPN